MKTKLSALTFLLAACSAHTGDGDLSGSGPGGKGDHFGRASELANAGCPGGFDRVASESECYQDVSCYRMEDGGDVFYCTGSDPLAPECREGLWRVESSTGCLQDDAVCEEVSGEETYFCTGPAPLCPAGYHEVDEQTPTSVSRWDQDGVERFCDLKQSDCAEGLMRVQSESFCLQDDAVCFEVTRNGETYFCTGPDAPAAS